MKNNQGFKNEALEALRGNWASAVAGAIVLILLMCLIIAPSWCANMVAFGQFTLPAGLLKVFTWIGLPLNILFLYPLLFGASVAFCNLHQGDPDVTTNLFKNTFSGYLRVLLASFLVYLFSLLWSLLLIIPGIIKGLAYSMTPYILKDFPELSPNQAINLSIKMMKGHKFDYFWLNLSFIGWYILAMFTLAIGFVWVLPYVQTANAAFYQEVKNEYLTRNN